MVSQLGVYPNMPYTGTTNVAPAASSRYTNTSYLDGAAPSDQFTPSDTLSLDTPAPSPAPTPTASFQDAVVQPTPAPTPSATPAATPTASFQNAVVQPTPTANAGYQVPVFYASSRRAYVSNPPAPTPYYSQPAPRQAERRPAPTPTYSPSDYHDYTPEVPAKKPVYNTNQNNQSNNQDNQSNQDNGEYFVPHAPKKKAPQPNPPVVKTPSNAYVNPPVVQHVPVNNNNNNNPVDPYSLVPSHVTSSILSPATLQALGNPFIGGVTAGNYVQPENNPSGGKPKGGDNWTQDLFGGILNNYFGGEQPSMDGINAVAGLQFTAGY